MDHTAKSRNEIDRNMTWDLSRLYADDAQWEKDFAEIDDGVKGGKGAEYVIYMCLLLVALGVVGLLCSVTAQYFAARSAVGFSKELRSDLFAKMQSLSYSQIDGIGTSKMITRMTSDVNQLQSGVNLVLRLFMRSPFIVFGASSECSVSPKSNDRICVCCLSVS